MRMRHSALILLSLSAPILRNAAAQPDWRDPSPHSIRLVSVAPSVALEVLDWGGKGRPLVFLAGGGHSGHVFDGFAPQFTDRFKVMAVSRRGVGGSSRATSGYDTLSLAGDLLVVLDSLGIERADFVGHSFAGSEMSYLAANHPTRVGHLVYLDSAFDYHTLFKDPARFQEFASPPAPIPAYDDNSVGMWLLYAWRDSGPGFPESEARQMFSFGVDGKWEGRRTPAGLLDTMTRGFAPVDFTRIRAPALALYADPKSAEVFYPWWNSLDSTSRARGHLVFGRVRAALDPLISRVATEVQTAQVVRLPGARHYLFLTHAGEVAHEIRRFLPPD
jgi:non-heme chloroperoxidase